MIRHLKCAQIVKCWIQKKKKTQNSLKNFKTEFRGPDS